jgi:MoaA/NifB/PqqE/SkfB family radical SAM enzyme
VGVFHLTGHCNLNCAYCEDYGARRPDDNLAELGTLSLAEASQVLTILRQAATNLIFTGGEPLLYPDIGTLVMQAKTKHRFKNLTLLTNGLLLTKHTNILPYLDRLVISLDSLDTTHWGQTIGLNSRAAEQIINTVKEMVEQRKNHNFELIANCVVTPETLVDVESVLDFCHQQDITFSFSPQSFNNWPHYDLLVTDNYRTFVTKVISAKQRGQKILGSMAYLNLVSDFQPFNCYPTLVPRVLPNGDLIYPCRPIERGNTPHGGRPCNLTQINSWREAIAIAEDKFDEPPITCVSCFQQCYAEPSLMQAKPFSLLKEMTTSATSRRLKIHTFAPG